MGVLEVRFIFIRELLEMLSGIVWSCRYLVIFDLLRKGSSIRLNLMFDFEVIEDFWVEEYRVKVVFKNNEFGGILVLFFRNIFVVENEVCFFSEWSYWLGFKLYLVWGICGVKILMLN